MTSALNVDFFIVMRVFVSIEQNRTVQKQNISIEKKQDVKIFLKDDFELKVISNYEKSDNLQL